MRNTAALSIALVAATATATATGCGALIEPLPPEDELPPAIAITSPLSGSTVSSVVTISTSVSSTVGATSVRFDLPNGASITDPEPPFAIAWNTTAVPDGNHQIHATAIDALGTAATTSAMIVVANRASPCGGTFTAAGLPARIPDAFPGEPPRVLASSINIGDGARIGSLALSLRITHPFPPDIEITLISPGQVPYVLVRGFSSDPDAAGIFIENQIIPAFHGQRAAGVWTIEVEDVDPGASGWLDAWSLAIAGACGPG